MDEWEEKQEQAKEDKVLTAVPPRKLDEKLRDTLTESWRENWRGNDNKKV